MRFRKQIAMVALVGAGLMLAEQAWAVPTLDQDYDPVANGGGAFSKGSFRRAQDVTVGLAGTLVEVDLDIGGLGGTFTGFNILATSGGVPTTTVLTTGTFSGIIGDFAAFNTFSPVARVSNSAPSPTCRNPERCRFLVSHSRHSASSGSARFGLPADKAAGGGNGSSGQKTSIWIDVGFYPHAVAAA
jgi:hypothetical protein